VDLFYPPCTCVQRFYTKICGLLRTGLRSQNPELGILPGAGAGAQITNLKDPELSLTFRR